MISHKKTYCNEMDPGDDMDISENMLFITYKKVVSEG